MPASRTAASNGPQVDVAQLARADVRRRAVHAALRQAVADHVLAGREHRRAGAAPAGRGRRPRRAPRSGTGPRRRSPRCAPSAGRARRRRSARAPGGRPSRAAGARSSRRAPRPAAGSHAAASPIDCGKHTRVARDEPVQALLVDDRRDAQPRLLDEEALDLVGQRGDGGHREAGRAGHARDLPDARAEARAAPWRARRGRRRGARRPRPSRAGRASPRASSAPGGRRRGRRPRAPGRGRAAAGDAQPLTAPLVRPRMSWRSANA